jgi:hypothetical protein
MVIIPYSNLGFAPLFILEFFPPLQYGKLINKYPSLGENVECVICLETMVEQNQALSSEFRFSGDQLIKSVEMSVTHRALSVPLPFNLLG